VATTSLLLVTPLLHTTLEILSNKAKYQDNMSTPIADVSQQTTGYIPQYVRYRTGRQPGQEDGKHHRASIDLNVVLHRRITRSKLNRFCASCACLFQFTSDGTLVRDSPFVSRPPGPFASSWALEHLLGISDDIHPFLQDTTWPWKLNTDKPTLCQLCAVLQKFATESERGPTYIEEHRNGRNSTDITVQEDHVPYQVKRLLICACHLANVTTKDAISIILNKGKHQTRLFIYPIFDNSSLESLHGEGTVRGIPGSYVDFKRVLRWLKSCDEQHSHVRMQPHLSQKLPTLPKDFRLIDIAAQNIISLAEAPRYAALSYVWGSCEQYLLLLKNLEQLNCEGALKSLPLSRVVKDAMIACISMEIPYLWVDSLCICQDDPSSKDIQIAKMHVIYSAAYVTLVDGRGTNANDVGLSRVSNPIVADQQTLTVFDLTFLVKEDPKSTVDRSDWCTRGWTLQEAMLSRRVILFLEADYLLICPNDIQQESFSPSHRHQGLQRARHTTSITDSIRVTSLCCLDSIQDIRAYDRVSPLDKVRWAYYRGVLPALNNYLARYLSNEDDVEHAFLGIAGAFQNSVGSFHHGLPTNVFVRAFLWKSLRYPSSEGFNADDFQMERRPNFPSWTWLGWRTCKTRVFTKLWSSVSETPFSPLIYIWGFDSSMDMICVSGDERAMEGKEGYRLGSLKTDSTSSWTTFDQFHPIADVQSQLIIERNSAPLSHLLVFWASSAVFNVSLDPKSSVVSNNHEYGAYTIDCGSDRFREGADLFIVLEVTWRKQMPQEFEFIAIAAREPGDIYTLVIERQKGLAYRVGVPWGEIQAERWIEAQPERKLIVLA
jgi:hypothetical protein